ncbi:MAG: restriction endonuclease subunit S [Methanospirillum sp.]|nr:restriction endonuclease subunit S [Methanospirillum sp.]
MIDGLSPYPEYRPSAVEWLGDVPAHWDILPGRACFTEKKEPNTGLKESTVLSLSFGKIVVKPEEKLHGLVPESFETYQVVDPGDIIIRPTDLQNDWNSLRFALSSHRGIITSAYLCFHTEEVLDRRYGHLLLHTYDLKKIFYGLGSGLRQNLNWSDFKYLPCTIPSLPEQAAIIQFLEHADRRIRRAVSAKRRLIALLNEEKQAVIHRAVTRGLEPDVPLKPSGVEWLGDVPAHWDIRRLKWALRLQRGYDLPQEKRLPGPYPVVSSGGIIDTHHEYRTEGPGVVMGRYGSTEAVFFITENFWPHNTSLFVTDFQGNLPQWGYYLLRAISKGDYSGKSAVPGINRKDLFEISVPVPPIKDQMRIVPFLIAAEDQNHLRIVAAQKEIDLLLEFRTRLIADVVTGKFDVRAAAAALPDEADEPAILDDVDAPADAEADVPLEIGVEDADGIEA